MRNLDPGKYQLVVFARRTGVSSFDLAKTVDIEIVGVPRQFMALDTPGEREIVGPSFDLSGWAADLRAESGTGVDVVHVWGYSEAGGDATFRGAAKYGMARTTWPSISASARRTAPTRCRSARCRRAPIASSRSRTVR